MKKNKKNRFKSKYLLALLLGVCIASMLLGAIRNSAANTTNVLGWFIAPMQDGINSVGAFLSDVSGKRKTAQQLEEENNKLQDQIDTLTTQLNNAQNNLEEYGELTALLGLTEKYPTYDMTAARIISKNPGNWYDTFLINKGSADGMEVDFNIISENGLVGIITNVSTNYSEVRAIIDDESSVSGMFSNSLDTCFVNGNLQEMDSGLLDIEMISKNAVVSDGDKIVTSYISDKYLPGLLIGYASNVVNDDNELTLSAKLTPAVDFQHLTNVMIIRQKKSDLVSGKNGSTGSTESSGSSETSDSAETESYSESSAE